MILQFRSLRTRILVLATLPLAALLISLLWISHRTTTGAVETAAGSRLQSAELVLRELVESRRLALLAQTRVTAADPRFFATFSVPDEDRGDEFVRTMELIAQDFLRITDADFIEIHDQQARPVLRVDRDTGALESWSGQASGRASILAASARSVSSDLFLMEDRAVLVADAPVFLGHRQEAVLRMGVLLGEDFAAEVRRLTGAELAIGRGDRMVVSTWQKPPQVSPDRPVSRSIADGEEYLCLASSFEGLERESGFTALLGRSTSAELAPLHRAERAMAIIGVLALIVTIVGGVSIAVRVTGPLHELVHFADRIREGDYTKPVPQSGRDEIGMLGRSLEDSRQALQAHVHRLEDLDRRRGEFLTLAGHELRTPLTVITSFNDMLHEGGFGELPDEVTETTAMIGEQLRHLNELVADILDLTALETAPEKAITVQEISLCDLVDRVNQDQVEARSGRDVTVTWERPDGDPTVRGDERLLARAVRALLDNAIRFTQDGGRVDITLLEKPDELWLCIADDGIGISPDDVRWVYDKLFEGGEIENHSSGRLEFQSGGMGLGLSITRGVVLAHGGRLEVESQPGQGSCFSIVLPAVTPGGVEPRAVPNPIPEKLQC